MDLLLITDDGTIIRMAVGDISIVGRNTQGVRLMRLAEGAKVVGVALAEADEEVEEADEAGVLEETDS
jgi:DNA gyrase subunit A